MWYSAPCNFNDAFDCDISINEKALFECFLKEASQERRIRQGSSGWMNLKGVVHKQIHNLQEEFEETKRTTGISCLSESDSSLLMWAHYADNHKGMCVEYELLKISNQLKFTPVPVIYTNENDGMRLEGRELYPIDRLISLGLLQLRNRLGGVEIQSFDAPLVEKPDVIITSLGKTFCQHFPDIVISVKL